VTFGTSNFEPAPVEPKKFVVRWGNPDGTLEERATETIERDGRLIEVPVYPKATCDLQPLKQLPPAQRDKILARIEEGSDDPDEIIDHLKRKGFDTSELE
jgi:hypothetical protein